MSDIRFEDVSFNGEEVVKFKNAEAFAACEGHWHLWPEITPEVKAKRLRDVYQIAKTMSPAYRNVGSYANNQQHASGSGDDGSLLPDPE